MPRKNNSALTELVKREARELGADLVGVAPIERFRNAPARMSPLGLMPAAKSAVVMAIHHLDAAVELGGEPTSQDIGPYRTQYTMNSMLDDLSFALARFIESKGFRALPIAASNIWRYHGYKDLKVEFAPDLAHRYAAVAAGLGEIGWSNLALTPEFGPRQRFVTVITDAPLDPSPMYSGRPLCDRCMACVKNCPTDAFRREVRGVARIEIGGKVYRFPETNKWRCSWGENFDLDLTLPIPDKVNEAVALAALEKHGMRGGEMGSCLRFCMNPARRRRQPSYSRAPRRKKSKVITSPAGLSRLVMKALAGKPIDLIAVAPAKEFSGDFAVHPKYHLPDVATIISLGVIPPKGSEGNPEVMNVLARGLDYASFRVAHALDVCGWSAVTRTNITDNLVAQRLGIYRGDAHFSTVLTSAKLLAKVLKAKARPAQLTPVKVREMCKDAGADLVGFFGLKRFEEFRAGMERVSFASKPNEGVVDRGLIYGPYVPQVRRESTKMLGPRDRLADAKSVIVLGLHFPHAALDTAKVTSAETTGPFAFVQYETLFRLRDMAYEIARRLSAAGFRATFVDDLMGTASQVKNSRGMIADMRANGFAALLAGLAQIGVHGYPMSREFGVRQRFIAVVTDCPLPSDPLPEWQRNCKTCSRPCIRACPTAALAVGKDVLRLEGKSFPLPAVDGFACDWAKRYGLSGPEGPQYWGVESDRPLPAERSAENVAEAVSRVKWGIQKRHINIAEECLRVCPARGFVKR